MLQEDLIDRSPEWVRWIAQDRDGAWWGFEVEPNEGAESWYENEVGRYIRLAKGSPNPDWRQALYRRKGACPGPDRHTVEIGNSRTESEPPHPVLFVYPQMG